MSQPSEPRPDIANPMLKQPERTRDAERKRIAGDTVPDNRPFYWTAPPESDYRGWDISPTGWYQWKPEGLVYLGASILEASEPSFHGDENISGHKEEVAPKGDNQ